MEFVLVGILGGEGWRERRGCEFLERLERLRGGYADVLIVFSCFLFLRMIQIN